MLIIHNEKMLELMRPDYSAADARRIEETLRERNALNFPRLSSGLFPAAHVDEKTAYTGYASVWVRDNIHVANAHLVAGQVDIALSTAKALFRFFETQAPKFRSIISGKTDPTDPMNRPHVRFDGNRLIEIDEKWAHAQNDALGYFLWFYCRLCNRGHLEVSEMDLRLLGLFPRYFAAIRYWMDEDSGHWEELRKISASSIGTVVAGLTELASLLRRHSIDVFGGEGESRCNLAEVLAMCEAGRTTLNGILPWECKQADGGKLRRYDAALLFLIYPLCVVNGRTAEQIVADVTIALEGDWGIRRYLGDSYWATDYRKSVRPERRTTDYSEDLSERNRLYVEGQEAQWCIFDPILSVIHGSFSRETGEERHRRCQIHHLNRALGQLTGASEDFPEFRCPELYYREGGRYVPSDATPLLWTQANLLTALRSVQVP
jgi:hypothetical protein